MKVMRKSGLPVNLDNLEAYKKEWAEQFDILKAKRGNDMLMLQADLETLEFELLEKYSAIEEWPLLSTKKAIRQKMEHFLCPIMIAQSSEGKNELVYVLMDEF